MDIKVQGPRDLDFVLSEASGTRSYETVTIKAGAGKLKPGTVLGKITTGGKYIPSPDAEVVGSEGAETAVAVLGYGTDATTDDTLAVVMKRDGEVKKPMLVFAASVNTDNKVAAKLAQLAAANIHAR
ncbi:head decoration protein [Paradevosia shaoguanensis]|uniref:Head decoration protein n=1 Tax=Paradevosia shaoguanensis TaxID=1335043 RepID=A0AA41QQX4_9HYPH|nr:head decoration protein [Paradevosia shaoguanensis]MCF1744219.1 head decoration protein [Paradevosia shaoguanensis]MCI0128702.1 head decoration protein [Paradevosia shaoguanensis]